MENGIGPRIVLHPKKTRKPNYVRWLNDLPYWWMGKSWTNTAVLTVEKTARPYTQQMTLLGGQKAKALHIYLLTDQPTDRPTEGWMDTRSYQVASSRLKMIYDVNRNTDILET